jgi:GNAT superfamily N-acetyltransferase
VGICPATQPGPTAGATSHDSATPTNPELVAVQTVYGSALDRQTAGRVQEILQRSFHRDPNRKGYYIPLPEELLLRGAEKDGAIDMLLAQAARRRELWHLAFDRRDGALAALATTFEHSVRLADGSRRHILALGEVATHPDYRGRGHGAAVRPTSTFSIATHFRIHV